MLSFCRSVVMSAIKPQVVFVLGGPGAGKGTQCAKIVQEYGFVHLSAGELLRQARDSGSEDGQLINTCMKEGKIVPVEITISLLMQEMTNSSPKYKFLIDGFPRNLDNMKGWQREVGNKADLKFVLFLDCPEQTCLERAMKRGEQGGRNDDNIETFRKRYQTYISSTMDIIHHYEAEGLVRKISTIAGPDEVFDEVKKLFDQL